MNGNKKETSIKSIRNERIHYVDMNQTFDKKLKQANNERVARNLYHDGFSWFKSGKKLEEAVEKIMIDSDEVALKDNISFQRGYQEGIRQLGFAFGYKEALFDDIPDEYLEDRFFLNGYKQGYEAKKAEIKKANKAR